MKFQLPKCLFGYSNFKWLIKELLKMYSNQPSFFSRKRVNEGIAFYSAIGIDLCYVYIHRWDLSSAECLFHVMTLLGIAGYHLKEIAKEKNAQNQAENQTDTEQNNTETVKQ